VGRKFDSRNFFMNKNELLAERNDVFTAAEQLVAKAKANNRELTATEKAQFDGLKVAIVNLDAKIARCNEIAGQAPNTPSVPVTMRGETEDGRSLPVFAKGQSMEAYFRQEIGSSENGEVTLGGLCRAMALGGGSPAVRAALAEGTDSAGGITVPVVLSSQLIDLLRARSCMFQAGALTMALDTGKSTTIASITADPVATWRAENAAVNASDMTFGSVVMTPKTLAVITTASRELVEDSTNLDTALAISLSSAFALELDRVALIGAGTGQEPKGVSKTTGVGSVSMGTNGAALTNYDPFINALGILQTANANDPTAVIINPRSNQELNLLKDTLNQPLRRPAAIENLPFLVTSKLPITETQGTSNAACRAVMGYFPDVIVGLRTALHIELLRETFAGNMQMGFLAYLRADIGVRHAANFVNIIGIN
jgi:HK97 family phage major capsid protein